MFIRHQGGYPPYYFTVKITCTHEVEQVAAKMSFAIYNQLKKHLSPQAVFLGPSPSAIMRVKNKYYYQMIIKYKHEPHLSALLKDILMKTQSEQRKGLFVSIDHEPLNYI